jgi:hypothetical protein
MHRLWFALTFVAGLVFMLAVPPMQTAGEPRHWVRLYSSWCDKLPQRALQLVAACEERDGKFHLAQLDAAMAATLDSPMPVPQELRGACGNAATAYLLPSLATRLVEAAWPYDKGATLMAFYGARLTNWLLLSLGVWLLLQAVPLLRGWTLFVYSLPLLMVRGASLNQDACIVLLVCAGIYCWQRGWRMATAAPLVVLLYTLIKLLPPSPVASPVTSSAALIVPAAFLALASDAMGPAAALWKRTPRPLWQNVAAGAALFLMLLVWKGALGGLRDLHYLRTSW